MDEDGQELVPFGGIGCSDIKVRPFAPICSHPEIGGSAPMALNIPVPSFAPAIPPRECVCFDFTKGETEDPVKSSCEPNELKAKFSLEIKPSTDCCTGKYTIEPHLDLKVPCVPFELKDASSGDRSITVKNKSGDPKNGFDGTVSALKLQKDCCNVQPVIDITFPDCVKYFNKADIPEQQITYCERGIDGNVSTKTWKLIEMVQDPEHCSLYPKVNPLELPCCNLPDFEYETSSALTTDGRGRIRLVVKRKNCEPSVSLRVSKINLGAPIVPQFCLETAESKAGDVTVKYKDGFGDTKEIKQAAKAITLTYERGEGGCAKYTPTMTLDLSALNISIGAGGDVLQDAGGNLMIDGTIDEDATTWYGGGIGNTSANNKVSDIDRRGPLMRNNEPAGGAYAVLSDARIPCDLSLSQQRLVANDGNTTVSEWSSSHASHDEDGNIITDEDGNIVMDSGSGQLSMALVSGFQWHVRGIAGVMSDFTWDTSGVLGTMRETTAAVLLSPAPTIWGNASGVNVKLRGQNASGLDLEFGVKMPDDPDPGPVPLSGLTVNDGNGLRIFGRDSKTSNTELSSEVSGSLRFGRLEVYADDTDFTFCDTGKLTLNDKKSNTENFAFTYRTDNFIETFFARDADYTIPMLSANVDDRSQGWVRDDTVEYDEQGGEILPTYNYFPWLHVYVPEIDENGDPVYDGQGHPIKTEMNLVDDLVSTGPRVGLKVGDFTQNLILAAGNDESGALRTLVDLRLGYTLGDLLQYCYALDRAVQSIYLTVNSLCGVKTHIARAGMIMGIDGEANCDGIERHADCGDDGSAGVGAGG